jgi:DNA-binding NarL/FixJ family response regulator
MPKHRILLVDDNPAFITSASGLLSTYPDVEVVGQASSGYEAIERVEALHPDLVLMDLSMPGMDGLEATRCIKSQPQAPCVVISTLYDSTEHRRAAAAAHADGFVAKPELGSQLVPLIHTLLTRAP